jgi:enoyl-CoA hydratase/carnithine racemase
MQTETILYEVQDGIATVTLNRPETMNAISRQLLQELGGLLDEIAADDAARVVLITGAGEKSFCTGADLKERASMSPEEVKIFLETIGTVFTAIEQFAKPVIAAVNGFAFGGGLELAMAADIRLAAASATMGLTETRLAIIPGAGGTQRLPRLVGRGKAKELIFTGRRIAAAEAAAIGLVNHVYPLEGLMEESRKLAALIGEGGPIAVQQAKKAINGGMETDLAGGLQIESEAYWVCVPTRDRLEGLAAFKEKRKPVYQGR